ncbi:CLUMA_CG008352, isoform A [Clunio marinus]|uniref:CLUMA_CG008352, isoform A n=1 Tax=Clunio marinus TaxID=568069 RepID=A0A1J1I5J1_9DIPT|nr:CLUMA_CG008352, isoform A [Clunio marinus]
MQRSFLHAIIILVILAPTTFSQDIFDLTTRLDDPRVRFLFHGFRNFVFNFIGKTGQSTKGKFLQKKFPDDAPFPCDISVGKSKNRPHSIHKLRPGDISVIGALGDSLTCSTGAMATNLMELSMENRGVAWSIGGQWNWKNATTLPNILKVFNPSLLGYSLGDSFPFHKESQFNLAEIGAVSSDMPYMAKALVHRIKKDKRVNFKYDWKMVTIAIGGNDICSFICLMENPESLPEKHRIALTKTLRYLKRYLPRTFVNVVSVPFVETVMLLKGKPRNCKFIHRGECSCWVGTVSNATKESRERWQKIQRHFIRVEEEVAKLEEFRGLDEFAVMYQPWSNNVSLNVDGKRDLTLLSIDCFHLSQKGNAWAATALWNNLLEPPNQKSFNWVNPLRKFNCPTRQHPFIMTYDNS